MMKMVSDISAIITCVLFIFYIIGRIINIILDTQYREITARIDFERRIDEIDDYDLQTEDGNEIVLLKSNRNIKTIMLYKARYNERKGQLQKVGKCIDSCKKIEAGREIKIKCIVPEGIPINIVEVQRDDFIIERFAIGYDGRNEGEGVWLEEYKFKRTILSWIYYMVR